MEEPTWKDWKNEELIPSLFWLGKWTLLIFIFWVIVPSVMNAYVSTAAEGLCKYLK